MGVPEVPEGVPEVPEGVPGCDRLRVNGEDETHMLLKLSPFLRVSIECDFTFIL